MPFAGLRLRLPLLRKPSLHEARPLKCAGIVSHGPGLLPWCGRRLSSFGRERRRCRYYDLVWSTSGVASTAGVVILDTGYCLLGLCRRDALLHVPLSSKFCQQSEAISQARTKRSAREILFKRIYFVFKVLLCPDTIRCSDLHWNLARHTSELGANVYQTWRR